MEDFFYAFTFSDVGAKRKKQEKMKEKMFELQRGLTDWDSF